MEVLATRAKLSDGRDVTLRSALPSDAAACLAYMRALSHESFRNLNHVPGYFDDLPEEAEAAFLASALAHPRSFLLSAWVDGALVGTAGVTQSAATLSAHTGELGIGVLSSLRGLGLGRILMDRLVFVATANGLTNLTLRVRTFNAAAIRLYESLGFVKVGTLQAVAALPEGLCDEHLYQRIAAAPA